MRRRLVLALCAIALLTPAVIAVVAVELPFSSSSRTTTSSSSPAPERSFRSAVRYLRAVEHLWRVQEDARRWFEWAERQERLYPRVRWSADWDGIASCETGSNWRMVGPRFSGGVGFANTTWDGFGGREFAARAGWATKEQQIVVAERVYARYGLSGWGCRRYG